MSHLTATHLHILWCFKVKKTAAKGNGKRLDMLSIFKLNKHYEFKFYIKEQGADNCQKE